MFFENKASKGLKFRHFILFPLIAREAEYKFLLLLSKNERVLWVDI